VTRGARSGGLLVAAALLTLGTLTGCSSPGAGDDSSTDDNTAPSSSTTAPTGAATEAPIEDAEPEPDASAESDAVAAAAKAVASYCRPGTSNPEWIVSLSPLLTDRGITAYETVDPATVPCTSVTGDAGVLDGDGVYTFIVSVPTDAGVYETYTTRPDTDSPWLVERMAPPA